MKDEYSEMIIAALDEALKELYAAQEELKKVCDGAHLRPRVFRIFLGRKLVQWPWISPREGLPSWGSLSINCGSEDIEWEFLSYDLAHMAGWSARRVLFMVRNIRAAAHWCRTRAEKLKEKKNER